MPVMNPDVLSLVETAKSKRWISHRGFYVTGCIALRVRPGFLVVLTVTVFVVLCWARQVPPQYLAPQYSRRGLAYLMTKPLIDKTFLNLGHPVIRHRATMATRVAPGLETVLRIGDPSIVMGDRDVLQMSRVQIIPQRSNLTGTPSGTFPGTYPETRLAARRPCSTRPVVPAAAIPVTFADVDVGGEGAGAMTVETAAGIGTWTSETAVTLPTETIAAANATVETGEIGTGIVSVVVARHPAVDPLLGEIFEMRGT